MADLVKKCPFDGNVTSTSLKYDCMNEAFPFKNLSEVNEFYNFIVSGNKLPWTDQIVELQPTTDFRYLNINEVEDESKEVWFPKARVDKNSIPRTLICHDYKGGYLEDRFINGSTKHDSYNFFNWTCVDIFVYFSHNFVTIPPPSWTTASHLHGVPVLGTVITEGRKGNLMWEQILESEEKAIWFADVLAFFADLYKFDGYLLNVENPIQVGLMPLLIIFIKSLRKSLIKHRKGKTYVIWYDSVTVSGELRWQNELNYNNKAFFDITDGIFLNYSWTEQNLDQSKKMAAERINDVFVGVDVFGRNMYGGGGYESRLAMQIIHQKKLSSAIFAFGWTKEKVPGNFDTNDSLFWSTLLPYFHRHGTKLFPFKSSFNRGCGLKYYQQGTLISDKPWFNLAKQNYQHSYLSCKTKANAEVNKNMIAIIKEYIAVVQQKILPEEEPLREDRLKGLTAELNHLYTLLKDSEIEYTFHDAYNGGGCIKINPSLEEGLKHVHLFDLDVEVHDSWFVKTIMKSEREQHLPDVELYPIVYVVVQTKDGMFIKIELRHGEMEMTPTGWAIRTFNLKEKGRILEIGLLINPTHRPVLLGEIYVGDR